MPTLITGYQKPMEAHASRIYFEQHRPPRIPPGDKKTWRNVIMRAMADKYTATEIYEWMRNHHKTLGYALPQKRSVKNRVKGMRFDPASAIN